MINYQFIIYACPVGELNSQLEDYFHKSRQLYGENTAHKYMPHCTLTGFFTDELSAIPIYIEALDKALIEIKSNNLCLKIKIKQLTFNENWHGLELQADVLKQLIANFARLEKLPTRQEKLRLKDWLHLSLAYDFNPEYNKNLQDLATEIIDLQSSVSWELRFYQKNPDWTWNCLKTWSIN
ncbi:MAG: hypothetical protein QNJ34_20650 [Xenococcaceae cyanobacterium MO_188.B29]|nr:hypothetical protein [Xenococcaceae cyanobacterium MO_188.B29]